MADGLLSFRGGVMKRLKTFCIGLLAVSVAAAGRTMFTRLRIQNDAGPVLTYDNDVKDVSIHDDDAALLAGITAQDAQDGDVSDSLVIEQLSSFVGDNERVMSFAAFDKDHHVTKGSKLIRYTDYTPTVFSLSAPLQVQTGTPDFKAALSAQDCLDGDISRNITVSTDQKINLDVAGSYPARFSVTNSAGDTSSFTATIDVVERTGLAVQIDLSSYLVYAGSEIDPMSYVSSVTVNGDDVSLSSVDMKIDNPVDYSTPGSYEITYTCNVNGMEGTTRLVVIVPQEVQDGNS